MSVFSKLFLFNSYGPFVLLGTLIKWWFDVSCLDNHCSIIVEINAVPLQQLCCVYRCLVDIARRKHQKLSDRMCHRAEIEWQCLHTYRIVRSNRNSSWLPWHSHGPIRCSHGCTYCIEQPYCKHWLLSLKISLETISALTWNRRHMRPVVYLYFLWYCTMVHKKYLLLYGPPYSIVMSR